MIMLLRKFNKTLVTQSNSASSDQSKNIDKETSIMSIFEDYFPQGSSMIRKQSKITSKKGWESRIKGEYLIKEYQAYDTDKYRRRQQDTLIQFLRNYEYNIVEPGEFTTKHHFSKPYHLFFSRIDSSEETHNQQHSITFPEILDRSCGQIVKSLHLTYIVDVTWVCLQYVLAGQRINMTILYGERSDEAELGDNVTAIQVKRLSEYGCHHTKIMILQYDHGGIRVVVSTANLFSKDWDNKTQGLWISPCLPLLPKSANSNEGESQTHFKKDLWQYLKEYKNPALRQWIKKVKKANFSDINVFLVASIPGDYDDLKAALWGHMKLSYILSHHATLPANASEWSLVAQSSSIGIFGKNYNSWLLKEIVSSMSQETTQDLKDYPKFQFIYPSLENYKQSYDYGIASPCLCYSIDVHSKQKWIESYLYQWRAKRTGRDQAMPHIKTYTRISPDLKSIPWFVLTSANLSKAAWGVRRFVDEETKYHITNYEAGVVFLPKFITRGTTFPIKEQNDPAVPIFPILYDLPLYKYNEGDVPLFTRVGLPGAKNVIDT